jgi:hypothetical protein
MAEGTENLLNATIERGWHSARKTAALQFVKLSKWWLADINLAHVSRGGFCFSSVFLDLAPVTTYSARRETEIVITAFCIVSLVLSLPLTCLLACLLE